MLTSKARYMAMLKGEPVDIVPRTPILMQFAAEYIGSNYKAFASDYRVLTKANVACARDFGMDQVSTISDPYRETQGFGAEIIYEENGVPHCVKPPLADDPDLNLLPDCSPMESVRMRDRIRAVEQYARECGDTYSILGWVEGPASEAADVRGVENFLIDLMTDEEFAVALMDRCLENAIAFACCQIEAGADTVGIGDAIASQVPPDLYERLIQPREKRLVEAIHQRGAFAKLHICGNTLHLMPGIADLGIDIMDVDHMVDIVKVRESLGTKVALAGNIDPVSGVYRGTPESIRATVKSIYASVGNPFLVNGGCEIPSKTPVECLKALCEPMAAIS